MQNLRIVTVQVNDSTNIDIKFTDALTTNLVTSNVSIISDTQNVPSAEVMKVKVTDKTLSINCQPLTPFATYFIQLQSTSSHPFISLNGEAKVPEDGVTNRYLIFGPLE